MSYPKFVISRLWRDGHVSIPTSDKILKEGDRLLVITAEKDALALTVLLVNRKIRIGIKRTLTGMRLTAN